MSAKTPEPGATTQQEALPASAAQEIGVEYVAPRKEAPHAYNQFLVRVDSQAVRLHTGRARPIAGVVPSTLGLLMQVCGSLFECPAKYQPIKPIGKGAYGVVW